MNKKIFGLFLVFFLIGIVSAGSYYDDDTIYKEKISKTYYDDEDDYTITRTIYAYYDNSDRLSTYDYRHGYSYRKSSDYWERRYDVELEDEEIRDYYEDRYDRDYRRYDRYDRRYNIHDRGSYDYYWMDDSDYGGNRIQYKYYPMIRKGVERNCYDYIPRGKLFYISCNDWLY